MPKTDLSFNPDDYALVADRIALFYERYPAGRIIPAPARGHRQGGHLRGAGVSGSKRRRASRHGVGARVRGRRRDQPGRLPREHGDLSDRPACLTGDVKGFRLLSVEGRVCRDAVAAPRMNRAWGEG